MARLLFATFGDLLAALMMKAARKFGTSVNFYQAARRNDSDDSQLLVQRVFCSCS
jgi:hypothetical protein